MASTATASPGQPAGGVHGGVERLGICESLPRGQMHTRRGNSFWRRTSFPTCPWSHTRHGLAESESLELLPRNVPSVREDFLLPYDEALLRPYRNPAAEGGPLQSLWQLPSAPCPATRSTSQSLKPTRDCSPHMDFTPCCAAPEGLGGGSQLGVTLGKVGVPSREDPAPQSEVSQRPRLSSEFSHWVSTRGDCGTTLTATAPATGHSAHGPHLRFPEKSTPATSLTLPWGRG